MNEEYAALITGFPLFRGFTLDGAQMLLDCWRSQGVLSRRNAYQRGR